MTVAAGRMEDAIGVTSWVRDRLNNEYGGAYSASVNIGGDPSAISFAGRFDTLGDFEAMRAKIMADQQIAAVLRMSSDLRTSAQDSIIQVIKPPGEPKTYAGVNQVMMNMANVGEAVPFALEIANFVDAKLGNPVGVMNAVTGNRAGMAWVGFSDSLDEMAKNNETLESDPDYLGFFKRSESLFVPGSLEFAIWQALP